MNLFKNVRRAIHATCYAPVLCLALSGAVSAVWADFTTGFETSSGYTAGGQLIGVDDTTLPGTTTWSAFQTGWSTTMSTTTSNPQSGTQALRIVDTSTAAYGALIDLNGNLNTTSPIRVSFGVALSSVTTDTGSVLQFFLGGDTTTIGIGAKKYWMAGSIYNNAGSLTLNLAVDYAAHTGGQTYNLTSLGTSAAASGQYITLDVTVDPTSSKYTSILVNGTEYISAFTTNSGGAFIPAVGDTTVSPPTTAYMEFVAGGATKATIDIDNLSVTSVPEAGSVSMVLAGLGLLGAVALCRRVRATV